MYIFKAQNYRCLTIYTMETEYLKEYGAEPFPFCTVCTATTEPLFYQIDLKKGVSFNRQLLQETVLLYLQKGEMLVNYGIGRSARLVPGDLFLLPQNLKAECVMCHDVKAFVCVMKGDGLKVCAEYSQGVLDRYMEACSERLNRNQFLCSLTCVPLLVHFFKHLSETLAAGITCLHYQTLKREEFLLYLHKCYSLEELVYFFYPIMHADTDFQNFVYANYRDIRDVQEFAEKANMSVRTFSRKFKDTFNDTASNWLTARRAEAILYDIIKTTDSFTEIATKHGFSSSAYLTNFCKQRFGRTPVTLRKNWGIDRKLQKVVSNL